MLTRATDGGLRGSLCLSLVVAVATAAPAMEPKSISVSLQAGWHVPSLLAETSEILGSISSSLYWDFLDRIASLDGPSATDEEQYALAKQALEGLGDKAGPAVQSVLNYSISLEYFAPRLEMFTQLSASHIQEMVNADPTAASLPKCVDPIFLFNSNWACGLSDFKQKLSIAAQTPLKEHTNDALPLSAPFDFDRTVGAKPDGPRVIVYADITSPSFRQAHTYLRSLAASGEVLYTLRPGVPMLAEGEKGVRLQGYGVELAIKSQEYKVLDDEIPDPDGDKFELDSEAITSSEAEEIEGFFFARLKERRPELSDKLDVLRGDLLAKVEEDASKVQVWDMQDLGVQAVGRILRAQDPLLALRRIAQDFPMYAPGLTKQRVNQTLKKMIIAFQKEFEPQSLLRVNSVILPTDGNPFDLHNTLISQSAAVDGLRALGLPPAAVRELMLSWKLETDSEAMAMMGPQGDEFRLDVEIGHEAITWLNDLESGNYPYSRWSPSVKEFLTPAFPNQLRFIAKNLYRCVALADPLSSHGLAILQTLRSLVQQNAPVALGVVFDLRRAAREMVDDLVDTKCAGSWPQALEGAEWARRIESKCKENAANSPTSSVHRAVAFARLFYTLRNHEAYGPTAAWEFIDGVASRATEKAPRGKITRPKLVKAFRATAKKSSMKYQKEIEKAFALGSHPADPWIQSTQEWVTRKGLQNKPVLIFNGAIIEAESNPEFLRRGLMNYILMAQMRYQHAVYHTRVTDATDLNEYIKNQPRTYPRMNKEILKGANEVELVDSVSPPEGVVYLPAAPTASGDKKGEFAALTVWVVSDLSTQEGKNVVAGALEYWESGSVEGDISSRIAIVHNPGPTSTADPPLKLALSRLAESPEGLAMLRALIVTIYDEEMLGEAIEALVKSKGSVSAKSIPNCQGHCLQAYGIRQGESSAICNGRAVKLSTSKAIPRKESDEVFEDLRLLHVHMIKFLRLGELLKAISGVLTTTEPGTQSDRILRITHRLAQVPRGKAASGAVELPDEYIDDGIGKKFENVIEFSRPESMISVTAVLNPLTQEAQSLAPLLVLLRDAIGASIKVYLSPSLGISEVPLKRFYRSASGAWETEAGITGAISFTPSGSRKGPDLLKFTNIRTRALLTLNVQAPDGWLVASTRAPVDLDNLLLKDLPSSKMNLEYGFEASLIEGQCIDKEKREPPAGLQLVLGNASSPHLQDTLVMYNLGYFQLKASPGVWRLRIAPGRHGSIYKIDDAEGSTGKEFRLMPIDSFSSKPKMVQVTRRPGKENVDLLEGGGDKLDDAGFFGSLSSFFGDLEGKKKKKKEKNAPIEVGGGGDTVHVFSLASGQLYERFLKIMMQSVVENTKSKVKFWFLSNFLSPQFKSLVPKMAAKLGFEVELVTYQWPKWLHRQSVRQRVIWGYKILFLDVLFPLSLKRIIYIDADQVVRGDVRELWDMDLEGAPYGYTPFCSSNSATNGFRFWDSGYWKNHLHGKPYHISALYVVDLARFRRIRAGDKLRSIYDNLSADPNSLANLDQDLPNYAQHTVPIFSLPQEWLWCETWCSMETLPAAKTIDLCNNPLTKKPKLDVARELLPEWVVFDERQRKLTAEIQDAESASSNKAS